MTAEISDRGVASGAAMTPAPETGDPYGPVHIDIERMERALAGPRWTLPSGLSHEEIIAYMDACAAGKIPPDVFPPGTVQTPQAETK